ncbi:hypothetical protein [Haladaptatus sp. R4]|uniref:hypothetical protein n=1 Tax=Haladaptatus sp. R4 TaxID=1679489 RepID=UPI000AEC83B4|nr:hypothetical protein [Haladaptatus sp. R4]
MSTATQSTSVRATTSAARVLRERSHAPTTSSPPSSVRSVRFTGAISELLRGGAQKGTYRVEWGDGPMIRWFDGPMVRWFDGSMVRWFDGSMVRQFRFRPARCRFGRATPH